jgi:hypothetical protein
MKKLLFLIVAIVVLGLIVSGCLPVVPPVEKDEATILTKAKPADKPPSGAHYNLNIIGKKSDWSGGGSYDNPARHTMFVPENTDEFRLNGRAIIKQIMMVATLLSSMAMLLMIVSVNSSLLPESMRYG